jgi:nucleoside-diphosphate-sugar epimerase
MKSTTNFYENKNVLVTGGAGFIGSYLVQELVKHKAKVTIFDNFSSGNINNLRPIFSQINIIYGDITNPFACFNATRDKEIVFHLAALVSVPCSIQNPQICHQINVEGTKNILEGCRKNEVKTFIFSSSAAVYGNKKDKCEETDKPNPKSAYAKSKLQGEELCKHYAQEYGIKTASLRYFNVYGKGQNPNGDYAAVVAKFKHNLENNKPLVIFGDGKQTRDFIHASKVAQANIQIAMQENLSGEIFNIASGKSINLFELIEQLEKETKTKKAGLTFQAARTGDIQNSSANCEKYKKLVEQR